MNEQQLKRYHQHRKNGINPVTARSLATNLPYLSKYHVFNCLSTDVTATGHADGWEVRVVVSPDNEVSLGEDDVTGYFTDTYTPGCIRNTVRDWSSDAEWYHPSNYDLTELPIDGSTKGMAKQVAAEYIAARIRQAMKDDADRHYVQLDLYLSLEGVQLGDAHLGWIDVGYNDEENYLASCCDDLMIDAIQEAELALHRLKTLH